ncbi:hypothetical protein MAXJ12_30212 [Mesorhizobium alhagi CCNWXJ12-2]|uniref:Uncharacterized protein n=2 Tax=Allomesorhizobium alhagi TaxID=475067 RepID=H0I0Q5_9HYPH|nr:hypothetical protein MAXJ12_30212 [Mesorhizobium alhagi CCNWXJ12-2]
MKHRGYGLTCNWEFAMKQSFRYTRGIRTAVVFAVLTATGAAAETYKKYGSEAGWDIYVTDGQDRGCLMSKNLTEDTQFQMGIVPAAEARGYLALYSKADAEIGAGEKVSVR